MKTSTVDGSDNLMDATATMTVQPVVDTLLDLDSNGGIDKVGSANLYGRRTSHEEFDGVLGIADSSKTYDGNLDRPRHLPNHPQGHRLDSRTTQSARIDAQFGATTLGVNGHSHQRVDERYAIGTLCLASTGNLGNIGDIG